MKTRKNGSFNLFIIGILLFGISILLWNCEKEEDFGVNQKNSFSSKFESTFNSKDFEKVIQYDYTVSWELGTQNYSEELKSNYYVFPLTYNSVFNPIELNKTKKTGNYFMSYKVIAVEKEDTSIEFFVFRAYEKIDVSGNQSVNIDLNTIKNFTGFIHLLNKDGELVFAKKLEKGERVLKDFYDKELQYANPFKSKLIENCVNIRTEYYTDWYQKIFTTDGGYFTSFLKTVYQGSSVQMICGYEYLPDYDPTGGGPGEYQDECTDGFGNRIPCVKAIDTKVFECQEGYLMDENGNCVRDVQIYNELTGKAACVYGKMVDNKDNINWLLKNFQDGDKPSEFNLKLTMSDLLSSTTNATTVKSGNTITIKVNSNTLSQRTSLGVARTIIHEGIHARLMEFASRNGSNATDFPGIYDHFRIYNKNWDHEQMAAYYRSTIANGLRQYDNAQHSNEFYDALAWEGLANISNNNTADNHDQIYTNAWSKLSTEEQNKIKDIIKNEKETGNKTC